MKNSLKKDKAGAKILITDDDRSILRMIERLLSANGYNCTKAASATEARDILAGSDFDLLLCDIKMPGESGMDFAVEVLSGSSKTAVIMVTGVDDPGLAEAILDIGVSDYIIKPFKPSEMLINISNALRRRRLEIENRAHRESLEKKVSERTAQLNGTMKKFKESNEKIIRAMAMTVERRDPYTAGHQQRVSILADAIARQIGFPDHRLECIRMAGVLHDLGKIFIPAEILNKPGRLSDPEFSIIKAHPEEGWNVLKEIDFPWPVAKVVLQHHERMDGSGYPHGIQGEDFLPEARVLAVADVVEAMASHRPYRPALGIEKALDEIRKNRGRLYYGEAVDACLRLFAENRFSFPQEIAIAA